MPENHGHHAWMDEAGCLNEDPELWFLGVDSNHPLERKVALRICNTCPSQTPCLTYAITEQLTEGIYGGTLPSERRNRKAHA